ncbi:DUF4875 domain-containing protein [Budvicia aquatica]|uniref:DUF4875 domain-containing protein n=1 Tax=Budvicia aquatica TaxID=82979 RepID=A0A2C6DDJ4_9GAMM|nr:DUF4875 domain-containing protein [Budvicia aquatica]PHI29256.1 hypothetical protein CRN84_07950 [Budvicia aquatica]VFS47473.1 Uncharacterised protein [Budvicia aquatica]
MTTLLKLRNIATRLIIGSSLFACASIAMATPIAYEIIQDTNTSIGSQRLRASITIIAPTAQDKASRAAVVKQAVNDKTEKDKITVVSISLIPAKSLLGSGALLAQAEYYADGCGPAGAPCNGIKWDVRASDIKITDKAIQIWSQSIKSANELAKKGIFEDEKITADVVKKLRIKPSEVDVPYIELEPVTIP